MLRLFRPLELVKATTTYTKRWRGKDGKWQYAYGTGGASKKAVGGAIETRVEAIYDRFRAKDYFSDDVAIANKIKQWEQAGKPEQYTEDSIRQTLNENFKVQGMAYLMSAVQHIKAKDTKWLKESVRYDQKMLKEVFKETTGIDISKKSNAQLKQLFESKFFNM